MPLLVSKDPRRFKMFQPRLKIMYWKRSVQKSNPGYSIQKNAHYLSRDAFSTKVLYNNIEDTIFTTHAETGAPFSPLKPHNRSSCLRIRDFKLLHHLKNLQLIAPCTLTMLSRNFKHYILSCTFFIIAGHVVGLTTWKTRRFCDWNWRSPQCERIYRESFSTCWNKHCVCTI